MNTTPKRKYKGKDVDMLITASTLLENATANKTFLQTKRSNWTDQYFTDLQTQVNTAIEEHLGIDSAQQLRQSTQVITNIQTNALKDLAELKVQLVEDYKNNPTQQAEILTNLGFNEYHKSAQNGDQEALIQLLYRFKTNLTTELRTDIIAKGTAETILDSIINYADTLKSSNVNQETFKGTKKTITAENIHFFNEIYDKVISISKISRKFFKDNPTVQDQFSFNKVRKNLNNHPTSSNTPPTP